MPEMLIFGCGYTATVFAKEMLARGWSVTGTTRSADKAEKLRALGIKPLIWPGEQIDKALQAATHVLISSGPDADGDPVLNALGPQIAERSPDFEWVGYLSTTGVYGNRDGGWVDESSPVEPTTKRGEYRKQAEAAWMDLHTKHGLPLHIFRLAGIYGPGRGPFKKVQAPDAKRIIKAGQIFSRTHVEDIAQVLWASITHPNPGAIYNVCDNDPAPPEAVLAEAARLLGIPVPPAVPFEEADMTPMARSFYSDSKKVSNRRILEELGVTLKYPDYRSGLRAMLPLETP